MLGTARLDQYHLHTYTMDLLLVVMALGRAVVGGLGVMNYHSPRLHNFVSVRA